jgi:YihY family inner membrane protein
MRSQRALPGQPSPSAARFAGRERSPRKIFARLAAARRRHLDASWCAPCTAPGHRSLEEREMSVGATSRTVLRDVGAFAHPAFRFVRRLLGDFWRNKGLLLAGAVAYNTLLSLVPLFTLLLVVLSHVVDEHLLIRAVAINLEFLVPGQASAITEQVSAFVNHRDVLGGIGIVSLLFFSAMAFSILENAMAMIFHHRAPKRRHPALSAVIPYLFVMALGAGLLLVTLITGGLEAVGRTSVHVLGHAWSLAQLSRRLLHGLGMVGSALMLTALYMVLPARRVTFRRALMGAAAATGLWEIVRHLVVWYFKTLSLVNVVYGSLATTVIVLLTLEVAALILLLGAQVIAELERLADLHRVPARREARQLQLQR